ncbi:MAG: hypothetical protein R3E68_22125 [Burkholderiaceae bacterium]
MARSIPGNSLVQVSLSQPPGLTPVEGLAPLAKAASLTLLASVGEEALDLRSLQVSLADSRIGATGRIGLVDTMPLTVSGSVQNLRPTRFLKPGSLPDERWRDTLLNAGFSIKARSSRLSTPR